MWGPPERRKEREGGLAPVLPPTGKNACASWGVSFRLEIMKAASVRDEVISRMVSRYLLDIYISQISEQAISTGSGLFSASRVELSSLLD